MKKSLFLLGLSLLSLKGNAESGTVILYGKPNQIVTCVSPNGKWACGTQSYGSSYSVAFVWNLESNEITPLGMDTQGYAVSDNGVVVGLFPDPNASTNGAPVSAAGYWKDGAWHSLGVESEQYQGYTAVGGVGYSISADGRYMGGMIYSTSTGSAVPVVWKDGELHAVLNDGIAGQVQAITNDGTLYGGWGYTSERYDTRQPLLWSADGVTTVLPGSETNPEQTVSDFTSDGKYALWVGEVSDGKNTSTLGIRDIAKGTDVVIPYASDQYWTVVLFDITDSLSAVGYEMDNTTTYPIIYKDGVTQPLETYLVSKGVDFGADGIIAPRSDGAVGLSYNLMQCFGASKDDSTFAIQAASVDQYEIPVIVKLNYNITNPAPAGVKASVMNGLCMAKVTWTAPLANADAVEGYNVYRDGEKVNTDPVSGTAFYDSNVAFGSTYSYTVEAVYAGGVVSARTEAASLAMPATLANAPHSLAARMKGVNDVKLTWAEPQRDLPTLRYYDDADEVSGMGRTYLSFEGAVRFDATDMDAYDGYKITAVNFVPRKAIESWVLNIYSGTELVYTQPITQELQYSRMNTVVLDEPLALPAKGDLYVAIQANVAMTETSSDILGMVYDKATFGYSDLVRVVGEDEWFYSLEEASEAEQGTSYPITFIIGAELTAADGQEAAITGYNIYRDGESVGTAQATEFVDEAVADGDHTYAVEAVYDGGEKSPQAWLSFTSALNTAAFKAISNVDVAPGATETQAVFSWTAPLDNDESNIQYCGNTGVGGVTGLKDNGYSYMARVTYLPSMLTSYGGYTVSALRFYPMADAEFTFTVEKDGETIVEGQFVEDFTINRWNTVTLDEPFVIDPNATYTVTLDCFDVTAGQPALAYDGQAAFSGLADIISMDDGETFMTIPDVYQDNATRGNWLIGMVANDGSGDPLPVESYSVRIDGSTVSQSQTATTYTHDFGTGAASTVSHRVNVDAVYSLRGRVDGSAVYFTLGELTGIADNVVNGIKISREGQSIIRVEGDGIESVELYNAAGALVAAAKGNSVNVSAIQGGMYILKVKAAAGDKTYKVSLSR